MASSASYDIESPTTLTQNAAQNYLGTPDMKKLTLTPTKNSPTASQKIKKSKSLYPQSNIGHWSSLEHETYIQYLMDHRGITIEKKQTFKNN